MTSFLVVIMSQMLLIELNLHCTQNICNPCPGVTKLDVDPDSQKAQLYSMSEVLLDFLMEERSYSARP